jgi:integrase
VIERRPLPSGNVSWRVRWQRPDGREESKSFRSRREAKAFDAARVRDGEHWVSPQTSSIKLGQIWADYIATQSQLKPSSRAGYERIWDLYIAAPLGDWPVGRLQFADVSRWVADLAGTHSAATTRKAYRVLSMTLAHGVRSGQVAQNVAAEVRLPKLAPRRPSVASPEQVELLASRVGPPADDLIRFLAYTGLRWGEATSLQCRDVDLRARRVHVHRTHVEIDGHLNIGTPKSNRSRQVPIVRPLVAMVDRRTSRIDPMALVFTTSANKPWRSSNFRRDSKWAEQTAASGLAGFRVHDLRHTAASIMIESGASVVDVAAVLGHASSHTTLTVYAHLIGGRLDDVTSRLSSHLENSTSQKPATPVVDGQTPADFEKGKGL